MRTIHVWAQSYSSNPGGIQTFTRFVVRSLCELYPEAKIVVFAKNDRADGERAESKEQRAEGADKSAVGGRESRLRSAPARQAEVAERAESKEQGAEESAGNPKADREGAISGSRGARPPRIRGFGRWPSALRASAFALSALRYARSDQPDLIISTHVNFAPVARLARKFAPARFAVVGHGIDVWKIDKASIRRALQKADQLIAVSDFTRVRMAEQLGIDNNQIVLLSNTFDEKRFAPAPKSEALFQRYRLSNEQPVILTVARMEATEQYKGYENVLRALPEVLRRFPEACYLIVGDGPDRKRVEELSQSLGVEEKVIFAGYVPNEELPDHYNLCDVFAMPSKGEGFGIVFLEALGCGKPVIAGNKDGSVEPLLNGKLGKLVDPDSVEQVADAICETLLESGQRKAESGEKTESKEQRAREPQLDPELLRHEVIAAFGYERFKERLGAILAPLLVSR